ncbi:unnamed protein product [Auanema sp. JU1783]|nr:unnamed protein product [Auanema sp. JU1783]
MLRWTTFFLLLSFTVMVFSKPNFFNKRTETTTKAVETVKQNKSSEEVLTSMRPDFSNESAMTCADKCTDFYIAMIKNHPEFEVERLRDESLACIRRCRIDE